MERPFQKKTASFRLANFDNLILLQSYVHTEADLTIHACNILRLIYQSSMTNESEYVTAALFH